MHRKYLGKCPAFRMYSINTKHYHIPNFLIRLNFIFFFFFLGPHTRHMEVLRLGGKSDLQLPAYATATAMQDLSRDFDLYHSLQQCWILNPLSEAKDRTHILIDTGQICFPWATMRTPISSILKCSFSPTFTCHFSNMQNIKATSHHDLGIVLLIKPH